MKEIELTRGYVAQVDDDDFNWLSKHSWHAHVRKGGTDGHVKDYVSVKTALSMKDEEGTTWWRHVTMAGIILDAPSNMIPDHIDGDPLNNCRSNLRLATPAENARNVSGLTTFKGKPTTSKHKGVSIIKHDKKPYGPYYYIRAFIGVNGKTKHLGYFKTEEEAAICFDNAARLHHGRFARLNFPCWTEQPFNEPELSPVYA